MCVTWRAKRSALVAVGCLLETNLADQLACPPGNVCYVVNCRPKPDMRRLPRWANIGLMHRSKKRLYSITSSAVASSLSGILRPSALAVLRLMTSSYLVGACTGRSVGLSPLRMRST